MVGVSRLAAEPCGLHWRQAASGIRRSSEASDKPRRRKRTGKRASMQARTPMRLLHAQAETVAKSRASTAARDASACAVNQRRDGFCRRGDLLQPAIRKGVQQGLAPSRFREEGCDTPFHTTRRASFAACPCRAAFHSLLRCVRWLRACASCSPTPWGRTAP